MMILLAIILGLLFGFVLQRIGAADPEKIIGMLTLKDLHLAKAIMLGVGLSSILLFSGLGLGLIDAGHLSIKSIYTGVAIGGLLLGAGWAIAGYCPGTGLVALGARRKDAISFILGGLVGAGIFTYVYQWLSESWLFDKWFGGKAVLSTGDSNFIWAFLLGALFLLIAYFLPKKL